MTPTPLVFKQPVGRLTGA